MIRTTKLKAVLRFATLLVALGAGHALGAAQGELRLALDGGNQHWIWVNPPSADVSRPITITGRCTADVGAPLTDLVTLSATGGPVGFVNSYGVRGPGGNGTPCERVSADKNESLTLELSGFLDLMLGVNGDMDIETKGSDVEILIETYLGVTRTGAWILRAGGAVDGLGDRDADADPTGDDFTSGPVLIDCNNDTDGGPDSGPNDNCRFLFIADFERLEMTPLAGEFSLDGGRDGGSTQPTTFELRDVFEGVCDCNEQCDLTAEDPDGRFATLVRHDNADEEEGVCVPIPYNLEWNDLDLSFLANYFSDPENPQTSAVFEWLVIYNPRDITSLRPVSDVEVDTSEPDGNFGLTTTAAIFDLRQQFRSDDKEYFLDLCRGIPNYELEPPAIIDKIVLQQGVVLDAITPYTPPSGGFSDMSILPLTQHGCWFQIGAKHLEIDTDDPADGMADENILLLIVRGFLQGDWSLRFK